MLELKPSSQYESDFRAIVQNRKFNVTKFIIVSSLLVYGGMAARAAEFRDHALKGEWYGYRECHVCNDVLLIYKIDSTNGILELFRIGTHSKLFKE